MTIPYLTVTQAAAQIGVSERRVHELAAVGRIAGEKIGKMWLLDPASVQAYAESPRKAGRPRKFISGHNTAERNRRHGHQ